MTPIYQCEEPEHGVWRDIPKRDYDFLSKRKDGARYRTLYALPDKQSEEPLKEHCQHGVRWERLCSVCDKPKQDLKDPT